MANVRLAGESSGRFSEFQDADPAIIGVHSDVVALANLHRQGHKNASIEIQWRAGHSDFWSCNIDCAHRFMCNAEDSLPVQEQAGPVIRTRPREGRTVSLQGEQDANA